MTFQIPNSKNQIPSKFQYFNDQNLKTSVVRRSLFEILEFGYLVLFEIWNLEFGILPQEAL